MSTSGQTKQQLKSNEPRPAILKDYDVHPVAALWPLMNTIDLQELASDILANGQREPIWRYAGQIIDGRNRLVACDMAGVTPLIQTWNPARGETVTAFIMSKNLHRRHLSASTRAAVAIEIEDWIVRERQAQKRREAQIAANHAPSAPRPEKPVEKITPTTPAPSTNPFTVDPPAVPAEGRARDAAAKAAGVSTGYVAAAKEIKRADPETYGRVAAGEVSIPQAQEIIVENARSRGDLDRIGLREGTIRTTEERLERRAKKSKPPVKFSKVQSSRVSVTVNAVFGNSTKAEEWLTKMQSEPSVLKMTYSIDE